MNKIEEFIKEKFKEYYKTHHISFPDINKREFGIGSWDKKIEMRHLSFNSDELLNNFLINDTPFYISCSSAYYLYPELRPMVKKEWTGADLIFDLDANKSNNIKEDLEEVKYRTINLIENFLLTDFGFSKNEIHLNFSGSNGYHIHIRNEEIRELKRKERREIVEYINGTGLNLRSIIQKTPDRKFLGPTPSDHGYRGKLARFVVNNPERYHPRKIKDKTYLNNWKNTVSKGNWTMVMKSINQQKLEEDLLTLGVNLSQDIDINVTIDLARLLRVPNTLHAGSSLCAVKITDLTSFEPLKDAIVFKENDEISIEITEEVPEIEFNNKTYPKLKKDTKLSIDEPYALFLLCKRYAKINQ
ncbi:DNA primase catalytic subunit PriS [Candidatus Micrarchaeota archaeon]|nr:DNA primase catalytic subunit PriS [Candidatus Micrarchaeota archaeon]